MSNLSHTISVVPFRIVNFTSIMPLPTIQPARWPFNPNFAGLAIENVPEAMTI